MLVTYHGCYHALHGVPALSSLPLSSLEDAKPCISGLRAAGRRRFLLQQLKLLQPKQVVLNSHQGAP